MEIGVLFFNFLHRTPIFAAAFASVGAVAQLVEQRTENPCVGGSIPPHTTIEKDHSINFENRSAKINFPVCKLLSQFFFYQGYFFRENFDLFILQFKHFYLSILLFNNSILLFDHCLLFPDLHRDYGNNA